MGQKEENVYRRGGENITLILNCSESQGSEREQTQHEKWLVVCE